jgi:hypothetical protein
MVAEEASAQIEALYRDAEGVAVWWAAEAEAASALSRLEREGTLRAAGAEDAFELLREVMASNHVVDPVESVREAAKRLLRVHDLRAADALQLGAALVASEGRPSSLELVCLDDRLVAAAKKEGFRVIDRGRLPGPGPA